jgi:gliding motility-associated-like protein
VGAESENLTFYAGENSTALPDPNNPPPGWIFENAQGYIFGFNGSTERFCLGNPYMISAANFNGDPNTLYFWEGNPLPGGPNYVITEPGTYQVRVQYFEGCYVDDFLVVEGDQAPIATLDEGPFCEGDEIHVYVSPDHGDYVYNWWNGETTPVIIADTTYTGGIYVAVIDPTNNCKATPNQTILVKPLPRPQEYLGDEVWMKYGQTTTMDAGPGDTWEWTSNPEVPIDNPDAQVITVPGYGDPNPVEYTVTVMNDGCYGEGFKVIGMFPPSKLGVPTAFSPNGDGDNDQLKLLGSGFAEVDFRIYDRYGKLVFETVDPDVGWDGTVNGVKQEVEVYTYYIRVLYQDKDVVEETGNITLLR